MKYLCIVIVTFLYIISSPQITSDEVIYQDAPIIECPTYTEPPDQTVEVAKLEPRPVPKEVTRGGGRELSLLATAYTHTGYNCATGIYPYVGVIAVDPTIIPLHSSVDLYLEEEHLGRYRALDTGGDIVGNRIDIFFDSRREALDWGHRWVDAVVREPNTSQN